MITFKHRGDFSKTEGFLSRAKGKSYRTILEKYANLGVTALKSATPKDSGRTSDSWSYEISVERNRASIYWTNNNLTDGLLIAILIQYGHGTGSGLFVPGRDFINPAMRPIFDKIAEDLWKEVTDL